MMHSQQSQFFKVEYDLKKKKKKNMWSDLGSTSGFLWFSPPIIDSHLTHTYFQSIYLKVNVSNVSKLFFIEATSITIIFYLIPKIFKLSFY